MNDASTIGHFSFLPNPDFHIQASPPATLTPASPLRERRAHPPSLRLSYRLGRFPSRLAPCGVPPPRERIDPDCPARGYPVARPTHSDCVRGPQCTPRGPQAVHPFRLRGRLGRPETASAPDAQ